MAGQPLVDQVEVGADRVLELDAAGTHALDGAVDVVRAHGHVLDALAAVKLQVFGNLALVVAALVDRDSDLAAGAGHSLALQACQLALDVEIAHLAKIEEALVELRPFLHPPAEDVMGQVVDVGQAMAHRVRGHGLAFGIQQRHEVHVVDADVADVAWRCAILALPAVDEIDQRVANALDGRNVELHRARLVVEAPGAQLERALVGLAGILDAERDRADRRAVQTHEALRERVDLGVDDEVDATLAVQGHVLVAVLGHGGEAHGLEQPAQCGWIGGRKFDELESVGAHRVVPGSEGGHACTFQRSLE